MKSSTAMNSRRTLCSTSRGQRFSWVKSVSQRRSRKDVLSISCYYLNPSLMGGERKLLKKQRDCKPGSVLRVLPKRSDAVPAIYLRRRSHVVSIVLPSGSDGPPSLALAASEDRSRRVAGLRELSTSGVHSPRVATRLVGSYPTFSPLPFGGFFLLHVQAIADFYPLGSGAPCVARTFLSRVPYL